MEPKMDRLDENRSERQGWGLLSSGARHFLEPTCTRVRHWAPPDPEERQARGHPPPPRELCRKRPSDASHTRRQPAWAARPGRHCPCSARREREGRRQPQETAGRRLCRQRPLLPRGRTARGGGQTGGSEAAREQRPRHPSQTLSPPPDKKVALERFQGLPRPLSHRTGERLCPGQRRRGSHAR